MRSLSFYPLNGRSHVPAIQLAARLAALAPGGLEHVFFGTGGAEAVETAVKIARQFWKHQGHPERVKIIGLNRGWHGCTLGALSASGVAEERDPFGPLLGEFPKTQAPYCYRCPHAGDSSQCPVDTGADLEAVIAREGRDTIAAVLAEPIMGLAGMVAPRPAFWDNVQRICRSHDILLIVDEVAVGFGRTGQMFASERYGLEPDLLVCAKGLTSGYLPLSAVLATHRLYEAFLGRAFVHGYTFGGHPASCAAALANIDIIEREQLCARARAIGEACLEHLRARLDGCAVVGEIRGAGCAVAVELVADRDLRTPLPAAPEACRRLARAGVLVRPVGLDNVLPFIPPLTIPLDVAIGALDAYCDVIHALATEVPSHAPATDRRTHSDCHAV